MRNDPTPAERRLWQGLRKHQLAGLKFRRQVPLGPFIADSYCPTARLVIELDGISHIGSRMDDVKDAWMLSQGMRVLRFTNFDVLSNADGVLLAIGETVRSTPPPGPLPQGEWESRIVTFPAANHV